MRKRLLGMGLIASLVVGLMGATAPVSAAGTARLNVVHGIPNLIVDVCVDKTENCFPLIPSGAAHNEMLLGPADEAKKPVSEEGMVLV